MKNLLKLFLPLLLVTLAFSNCGRVESSGSIMHDASAFPDEGLVERGEYLTGIIGCDHCHTPKKMTPNGPVPDRDRWMMGFPAGDPLPPIPKDQAKPGAWVLFHGDLTASIGPWGISYGANLTPHETGIGNWSYEHFKRALTQGKHKGLENGRPLMPPMPWQSYAEMKDDDIRAIFAYLKSIKPIENIVPTYVPPGEVQN